MAKSFDSFQKSIAELKRDEEKLKSMSTSKPWAKKTTHISTHEKSTELVHNSEKKEVS